MKAGRLKQKSKFRRKTALQWVCDAIGIGLLLAAFVMSLQMEPLGQVYGTLLAGFVMIMLSEMIGKPE